MAEPKILFFDIESTGLNATFGTILCIGHKWFKQKNVYVPTILDDAKSMLDDKALVRDFADTWNEADYVVSWFGKRFDVPMIESKMLKHKLGPLAPKYHLDLWEAARKYFKLHSNRLAAFEQYLGTESSKTAIDFDSWLRAAHGDKKAIAEVVDHCRKDVMVLEEVFVRMRPWLEKEPPRALFTGEQDACPSCGGKHIEKRGYKVAATRMYKQLHCLDCGKWFRSAKAIAKSDYRGMSHSGSTVQMLKRR